MSNQRPIGGQDRSVTQQALAIDPRDYAHFRVSISYTGVILNVYYSDDIHTLGAQRNENHRGVVAECSVLCNNTNSGAPLLLDHVRIPPSSPSGLADFSEQLPRGSSVSLDGSEFSGDFTNIDPHTLDGDWCVVNFLGGNLDRPYISNWWAHPQNRFDPATSGLGNPDSSGNPTALDQRGRTFTRTGGVEHIITKEGDVYFSTEFANSELVFGTTAKPVRGSFPHTTQEDFGGSVNVRIKQSQTLELGWDPSVEGVGINSGSEKNTPQKNPPGVQAQPQEAKYASLFMSKDDCVIKLPTKLLLSSGNTTTIIGKNLLELDSDTQIKAGKNADQPSIRGEDLYQWLSNLTVLTATGPAKINPANIASFTNPLTGDSIKSAKNVLE